MFGMFTNKSRAESDKASPSARKQELENAADSDAAVQSMRTYTLLRDGLLGGEDREYMEAVREYAGARSWRVRKQVTSKKADPANPADDSMVTTPHAVRAGVTFFEALKSLVHYQSSQPQLYSTANMRVDETEQERPGYPRDWTHFQHIAHGCGLVFDIDGEPVVTENGKPLTGKKIPESELAILRYIPRTIEPESTDDGCEGLYWQDETESFVRMDKGLVYAYIAAVYEELNETDDRGYKRPPRREIPLAKRISMAAATMVDWDKRDAELAAAVERRQQIEEERRLQRETEAEIYRLEEIREEILAIFDKAVNGMTEMLVTEIGKEAELLTNCQLRVESGAAQKPKTDFSVSADLKDITHQAGYPIFIKKYKIMTVDRSFKRIEPVVGDYETLRGRQSMKNIFNALAPYGDVNIKWDGHSFGRGTKSRERRDFRSEPGQDGGGYDETNFIPETINIAVDITKDFDPNKYPLSQPS